MNRISQITEYTLVQQSKLVHVDIYYIDETGVGEWLWNEVKSNPLTESKDLKAELMNAACKQKEPVIYLDKNQVIFSCINSADGREFLLIGPMALKKLDVVELHYFYKMYSIKPKQEQELAVFTLSRVLSVTGLMNATFTGRVISDEELISVNHLSGVYNDGLEQKFLDFDFKMEEESRYHHSYGQEKRLLDCVREGRVEDALQMNLDLDFGIGRLSENDVRHWHYLTVVAITLCTRAAIEGGMSPAEAYKVSDYYIQKSETCKEVSALVTWRNQAVRDLTERVFRISSTQHGSNYVENAKNYIATHYREKIYLEDVAEKLSISPTYLSKLFVKETGERMHDYIVRLRVERAANLLIYSEETISYIAEYVNFPSQSYLIKMFKKYKDMTPRKYRDRYKPREFES